MTLLLPAVTQRLQSYVSELHFWWCHGTSTSQTCLIWLSKRSEASWQRQTMWQCLLVQTSDAPCTSLSAFKNWLLVWRHPSKFCVLSNHLQLWHQCSTSEMRGLNGRMFYDFLRCPLIVFLRASNCAMWLFIAQTNGEFHHWQVLQEELQLRGSLKQLPKAYLQLALSADLCSSGSGSANGNELDRNVELASTNCYHGSGIFCVNSSNATLIEHNPRRVLTTRTQTRRLAASFWCQTCRTSKTQMQRLFLTGSASVQTSDCDFDISQCIHFLKYAPFNVWSWSACRVTGYVQVSLKDSLPPQGPSFRSISIMTCRGLWTMETATWI